MLALLQGFRAALNEMRGQTDAYDPWKVKAAVEGLCLSLSPGAIVGLDLARAVGGSLRRYAAEECERVGPARETFVAHVSSHPRWRAEAQGAVLDMLLAGDRALALLRACCAAVGLLGALGSVVEGPGDVMRSMAATATEAIASVLKTMVVVRAAFRHAPLPPVLQLRLHRVFAEPMSGMRRLAQHTRALPAVRGLAAVIEEVEGEVSGRCIAREVSGERALFGADVMVAHGWC